ncbi:hypothetical protein SEPCBS119000_005005, partial [Sporothrix epigloea]
MPLPLSVSAYELHPRPKHDSDDDPLEPIENWVVPSVYAYKAQLDIRWRALVHKRVPPSEVMNYIKVAARMFYEMIAAGTINDARMPSHIKDLLYPLRDINNSIWFYLKTEFAESKKPKVGDFPRFLTEARQLYANLEVTSAGQASTTFQGHDSDVEMQQNPENLPERGSTRCPACRANHDGACRTAVMLCFPDSPVPDIQHWSLDDSMLRAATAWLKDKANKKRAEEWHVQLLVQWKQEQNSPKVNNLNQSSSDASSTDPDDEFIRREYVLCTPATRHVFNDKSLFVGPIQPDSTILVGVMGGCRLDCEGMGTVALD